MRFEGLPGWELVEPGLADLARDELFRALISTRAGASSSDCSYEMET